MTGSDVQALTTHHDSMHDVTGGMEKKVCLYVCNMCVHIQALTRPHHGSMHDVTGVPGKERICVLVFMDE
jgi:hypothetical protein